MNNIIECAAILLIIGAMMVIFFRAGKGKVAISTIPLVLVPLMHIISWIIIIAFNISSVAQRNIYIVFDLIGLAFAAVMAGICAGKYKKRGAIVYLSVSILFCVALTAILIINNLQI